MGFFQSGSPAVDAVGQMNISGNVTPQIWYRQIVKPNTGKPYLLAIAILSDIVYWYRPTEIRDEASGQVLGWKKKFRGDLLQKSYADYADFFGESKLTIRRAMDVLQDMGLIKRVFRNIETGMQKLTNIMYISLDPETLYHITYPDNISPVGGGKVERKDNSEGKKSPEKPINNGNEEVCSKMTIPSDQICSYPLIKNDHTPCSEMITPSDQICSHPLIKNDHTPCSEMTIPSGQNCPYPLDKFDHTNTKNTPENTTEITDTDYINPLSFPISQQEYKDPYSLDDIRRICGLNEMIDHGYSQKDVDLILQVLYDVINTTRQTIRVLGAERPAEVVRSKLLKLRGKDIAFALDIYRAQRNEVLYPIPYMVSLLYVSREQRELQEGVPDQDPPVGENMQSGGERDVGTSGPNKDKGARSGKKAQKEKSRDGRTSGPKSGRTVFSNFNQREYDFEELEKMLLNTTV